ncbi:hypothetical protein D3C80_985450 [compost metagenome]
MFRWLQFQQRVLLGGVEVLHMFQRLGQTDFLPACHMQDLSAEPAVAQKRAHMVVSGEEPLPLLFPVKGGTLRVQGRIDRVRIIVEGGIARIQ